MGIQITGVHHLMITVGDLGSAKHFYGSIMGFEEKEIPPCVIGERVWYHLGPIELHINVHPEYRAGLSHFAISVEPGKYDEYVEKIKNTGYEKMTKSEIYDDGLYRVYIHDPFENCIEIINTQMGD